MQDWQILTILAALGLASLLMAPIERLSPTSKSRWLMRGSAALQPAIFVAPALLAGATLGRSVGLGAPLVHAILGGGDVLGILEGEAPVVSIVGLLLSLNVVLYETRVLPTLVAVSPRAAKLNEVAPPILTRVLYGGIVEEILTRWGLLSLLVWACWRISGAGFPVPGWCYGVSITLSALLFAAGHLPVFLGLKIPIPPWFLLSILGGNFTGGLVFGWLFWRFGIEAAMLGHALAHVFAAGFLRLGALKS